MGQASNCFNEGCPGLKRKIPGVYLSGLNKKKGGGGGEARPGLLSYKLHSVGSVDICSIRWLGGA